MTTGNSSPLLLWIVIMRTTSSCSLRAGASPRSFPSSSMRSIKRRKRNKPRNELTHILAPCHKVLLNWPVFADHLEYLLQSHNILLPYKYAKLTLIRHLLWPIFEMMSIDLENDLILEPVLFPRTPLEH